MATIPLPLSDICDISVTINPAAFSAPAYNQGLLIGPTAAIATFGRLQQFTASNYATAMLAAGFTPTSPEYIAAGIYFSANPAPAYVWIGAMNATAIQTLTIAGRTVTDGAMSSITNPTYLTSATAAFVSGDVGTAVRVVGAGVAGADLVTTIASISSGTVAVLTAGASTTVTGAMASLGSVGAGYKYGDTITPTQGTASGAVWQVLTVGDAGQVTSIGPVQGQAGTGYTVANNLPTTTNSVAGSGLKTNITAVGETLLQAAQACRLASSVWWAYMGIGISANSYLATDADHLANAAWSSPNWQQNFYFGNSSTAAIAAGTAGNLALQMKALNYKAFMTYSTTQSGQYPNNVYAAASAMGVAMGLNTGLANSFFTMAHKALVGIAPEPLTQTQYGNITGANFSTYGNFSPYQLLEQGRCPDGNPFYLYLFVALLVSNMQYNVMNDLSSAPAIPQDNYGQGQLLHDANTACQLLASIGFLAGAIWNGATLTIGGVTVTSGVTPLPSGYLNLSAPYSQQSSGAHAAGQSMPIYCLITSAGAVGSVLIGIQVQL